MTPHFNFFPSLNTRNIPEFNCESINDNYNESNKISGINMVGVTHTSIQATYFFFFGRPNAKSPVLAGRPSFRRSFEPGAPPPPDAARDAGGAASGAAPVWRRRRPGTDARQTDVPVDFR